MVSLIGLLAFSAVTPALATLNTFAEGGQARELALEKTWSEELDPETKVVAYKSPVERVVVLLQKMKAELEKEASEESAMYDKMVCWCDSGNKEKTKAVAAAENKDAELSAEVEQRAARFGTLATEIERIKAQIAKDTESLNTATSLREKVASKFSDVEKDLVQSVTNLKNAIFVLSKHHDTASLVQLDAPLFSSIRAVLHDVSFKYEFLLGDSPSPHSESLKLALVQDTGGQEAQNLLDTSTTEALPVKFAEQMLSQYAKDNAIASSGFLQAGVQQPIFKSYSPRSSQIFGILKQMQDEFESSLTSEQREELKAIEDFKALSKAKTAQIATAKEKLDAFETDHAENQKALSDAKEDLELTRAERSSDVEFLRNLKLTCNDLNTQWQSRSKARADELGAVQEAIVILTTDDNRDLLRHTVTLMQIRANTEEGEEAQAMRARVVASLKRSAQSPAFDTDDLLAAWHDRGAMRGPRAQLSTLAVTAQLDSFTKVKEVLDTMMADLKVQQEEEVKLKARCGNEFDVNEKTTYRKNEEKGDLEANMDHLTATMDTLSSEIGDAKSQISESQKEIKQASENREKENAEFQTTIADQRATQTILKKAVLRLAKVYKAAETGALFQTAQTPPVQFNKYEQNAGASPVLGLLEQIIGDSVKLENDAIAGETRAQTAYETMVKDTNGIIAKLSDLITEKIKMISSHKMAFQVASGDHQTAVSELESLALFKSDLHAECDFTLKNFDIRQAARLQEIEAIQLAKAYLSGQK